MTWALTAHIKALHDIYLHEGAVIFCLVLHSAQRPQEANFPDWGMCARRYAKGFKHIRSTSSSKQPHQEANDIVYIVQSEKLRLTSAEKNPQDHKELR